MRWFTHPQMVTQSKY